MGTLIITAFADDKNLVHIIRVTSESQAIKNVFSIFSSTLPSKTYIGVGKNRLIVINNAMIKK